MIYLYKGEDMKEKLNTSKLNELIQQANKILKIVYFIIIIIGVYAVTMLCKEWKILKFIGQLIQMLTPLFIGIGIAWLFDPLIDWLNKKGVNRILGTILTYAFILGLLFLGVYSLIPLLSGQINEFVGLIPNLQKMLVDFVSNMFSGIDAIDIQSVIDQVLAGITEFGNNLSTGLPETIVDLVKNIFSGLGTFVLGLIIGFFLLFNFDAFDAHIHRILPLRIKDDYDNLMGSINDAFRKYVHGTLLLSLIVGILSTIFLAIAKVPSPVFFGLFCGLTNLIPYLGPYIGAFPPIVIAFTVSPTSGILAVLLLGLLQFIEGNFLQPIIMSKTMQLHPVTILVGLLIFGSYFGIFGMILATPIMAAIKILWQFLDGKFHIFSK